MAALERAGRAQDTRLGLTHARDEARVGGRPTVMTPERLTRARELRAGGATCIHITSEPEAWCRQDHHPPRTHPTRVTNAVIAVNSVFATNGGNHSN